MTARLQRHIAQLEKRSSSPYAFVNGLGAALGALLVSTWLIPVLGVTLVCLSIAALNLLAAGVMLVAKR